MMERESEDYEEMTEEMRYRNLQRQLHKRYLNSRKGSKTETTEILEHTLEILHDTNTIVNLGKDIKNQVSERGVAKWKI